MIRCQLGDIPNAFSIRGGRFVGTVVDSHECQENGFWRSVPLRAYRERNGNVSHLLACRSYPYRTPAAHTTAGNLGALGGKNEMTGTIDTVT